MVIAQGGFFYPILTRIFDSFSCSPLSTAFNIGKKNMKRLPEDPEFAEIRHGDVILTLRASSVRPTCGFFVIIFPTDWYGYVR